MTKGQAIASLADQIENRRQRPSSFIKIDLGDRMTEFEIDFGY